ncbi:hypothetical protein PVAND_012411 [Polypedilum vanderplanki]|uniref:Uncharacterized protein n=1 Tax=Polypedilum vanderplanki TaxID=319348 RepID=A0A9J6CMC1_POLVA|nr:hypothetical protein PVAND_012411 [Polypedilum vanderplanki]
MANEKPKIIFVLGAPGAGKGTQCEKIVNSFGFKHLSAGDLLREERAREGSQFGQLIEDYITNGKIVPVEITCSLLENAMIKSKKETGVNKFLIDGFPQKCVERCLKRGQAGSGRTDDNLESLKKRFNTYLNDTMPIIDHYRSMNKVRKIDTSPSANEVFAEVELAFKEAQAANLF